MASQAQHLRQIAPESRYSPVLRPCVATGFLHLERRQAVAAGLPRRLKLLARPQCDICLVYRRAGFAIGHVETGLSVFLIVPPPQYW